MGTYFNIHNHTMYSNIRLLDCINRPDKLIKTAFEMGLSGIAITDHEVLGDVEEAIELGEGRNLKYFIKLNLKAAEADFARI